MTTPAVFEITRTAEAGDIDDLGHVNNVAYLGWIQDIASRHWAQLAPPELRAVLAWVVLRHEIDYKLPLRAGETARIRTWVGETAGVRSVRHVRIETSTGQVAVEARTTWCLIDPVRQKPIKIDERIRQVLEKGMP